MVAGGWRSDGQRATVAVGVGGTELRRRRRVYSEDSVPGGANLVSATLCRAGAMRSFFGICRRESRENIMKL